MSAPSVVDRVLALLPEDGRPMLYEALVSAARAERIGDRALGSVLAGLCTERRAAVEPRDGYWFARRLAAAAAAESDFPLRARPTRPAPRRRAQPRSEARR